jgi:hypothetical protein
VHVSPDVASSSASHAVLSASASQLAALRQSTAALKRSWQAWPMNPYTPVARSQSSTHPGVAAPSHSACLAHMASQPAAGPPVVPPVDSSSMPADEPVVASPVVGSEDVEVSVEVGGEVEDADEDDCSPVDPVPSVSPFSTGTQATSRVVSAMKYEQ